MYSVDHVKAHEMLLNSSAQQHHISTVDFKTSGQI